LNPRTTNKITCFEQGELLILRVALAPLCNESASKPDLLGSSGAGGSELLSEDWFGGDGALEGEEEKKGNRKEESA